MLATDSKVRSGYSSESGLMEVLIMDTVQSSLFFFIERVRPLDRPLDRPQLFPIRSAAQLDHTDCFSLLNVQPDTIQCAQAREPNIPELSASDHISGSHHSLRSLRSLPVNIHPATEYHLIQRAELHSAQWASRWTKVLGNQNPLMRSVSRG